MEAAFNIHPEAWNGVGSAGSGDIASLQKALEAQQGITDIANLQSVGALQPQSLEGTLALLTHSEKHLTLWRDIPKGNAFSTLEEYSVQTGYGSGASGWVDQLESPLEGDPTAKRKFAEVKFLRQMWKVSDISGIVTTIKDSETWAKQAATMRLLRELNKTLYSGDSAMISQQIDGFETAIRGNGSTDHIKDLRGGFPVENDFRELAELITSNFGVINNTALYCSPGGQTTIDQILGNVGSGVQRFIQGTVGPDGGISIGSGVRDIHTSFGTIKPKVDIFIAGEYESRGVPKAASAANPEIVVEGKTSTRSPDTPTHSTSPIGATAPGTKWATTGVRSAGLYKYRVAAGNKFGLSIASPVGAGATVVLNGAIDITITPNPNSIYPATFYEIYSEQETGDGKFLFVDRIADGGTATTVFRDLNIKIPGTTKMFLLDLTSSGEMRTFMLARLASLHSKQYATIGEFKWGVINFFAATKFYAPLRFAMLENVKIGIDSKSPLLEV